jgi:hypothetical protein
LSVQQTRRATGAAKVDIAKRLENLRRQKTVLKVGMLGNARSREPAPEETPTNPPEGGKKQRKKREKKSLKAPINNVGLAVVHEYGYAPKGIPPRPFLRPPVVDNRDTYFEAVKIAYQETRTKSFGAFERALKKLGQQVVSDTRAYVRDSQNFEALSKKTIERKRSRKPLLDTGQMVRSIDYVVVDGGGR